MATSILNDDNMSFWWESKKLKPKRKVTTDAIVGVRESKQIAGLLAAKCNKQYNSVDEVNR